MSGQITLAVEAKVLGQRKPLVANWSVDVPVDDAAADGTTDGASGATGEMRHETVRRMTLRELLALVVADEVAALQERQQERRLTRVMTRAEIEREAARGKIEMGGRDLQQGQEVRTEDAVAAALQAFEDRLYLVLLDGAPVETLDTELALHAGSRLTFVRLVALAGG